MPLRHIVQNAKEMMIQWDCQMLQTAEPTSGMYQLDTLEQINRDQGTV